LNKSARDRPFIIAVSLMVFFMLISFGSVTYTLATLLIEKNHSNVGVGKVGVFLANISANKITVANTMDCVMRARRLTTAVEFSETEWFLQNNGWYYYYRVIGENDTNKSVTVTGVTSENVIVELCQAQYRVEKDSSGNVTSVTGGFLKEWSSRDMSVTANENLSSSQTSDGIAVTDANLIMMFSGHQADRRVPESEFSTTGSSTDRFQATRSSDGTYYTFDKIRLGSASTSFESLTEDTALTIYNNTRTYMVYTMQIIDGGHQPTKASTFSNGNWTTYVDTGSGSDHEFSLATESTASTYSTYFVSKIVAPGAYVDLTTGSDNQLCFDSAIADANLTIHLAVSGIDCMSFYKNYIKNPSQDKYLVWLKSLESNQSGSSYYTDFAKLLS